MKIKQQFAAVTMVVGLFMAITCGVGYYMAQSMLSNSIEQQLLSKARAMIWITGSPPRLPC